MREKDPTNSLFSRLITVSSANFKINTHTSLTELKRNTLTTRDFSVHNSLNFFAKKRGRGDRTC